MIVYYCRLDEPETSQHVFLCSQVKGLSYRVKDIRAEREWDILVANVPPAPCSKLDKILFCAMYGSSVAGISSPFQGAITSSCL